MRGMVTTDLLVIVVAACVGCGETVYVYAPPRVPAVPARVPPQTPPSRSEPPAATEKRAESVGASVSPGAEDSVVATVNGKPVTHGDLVNELMVRHGKAVLEDLIRTSAVEQEVERSGVTISEGEIEGELARGRAAFRAAPGEHRTFEDMVAKRYGMSMEGYRGIVRRGLMIRKAILRRENPVEDEILLWFYQNRDRYDIPAEITLSHIFIAKEDPDTGVPRQDAWVRARLEKIRKALIRDRDFGDLARMFSDDRATRKSGGELGTVNERAAKLHLDAAFFDAMMVLKSGQAGGPVETTKGFHFIKVTARKDGRRVEYHEVGPRVRVDYIEERAVLLGEVFLRSVMERARIERHFEPPTRR